jgi:hypothetical protein
MISWSFPAELHISSSVFEGMALSCIAFSVNAGRPEANRGTVGAEHWSERGQRRASSQTSFGSVIEQQVL